jgi:hypothetical protein
MHDQEFLDQYFEICRRIYEARLRDGTWLWESDDSQKTGDLVESEHNQKDI